MNARLHIFLVIASISVATPSAMLRAAASPDEKGTAVIGMIHHVKGNVLTLKDVRVVGTTQLPPGLGTDGLLEVTLDRKTKGATSELKAGDVVQVSYNVDRRKRMRVLSIAPAPRH